MALFTPSASPAVTVKEIDLSGVVPNVQTTTGAFVGNFGWGPVGQATLVSDESGLVEIFTAPTTTNTVDFHSAAYFLRYSNTLQVVRETDSDAKNSFAVNSFGTATAQAINGTLVKLRAPLGDTNYFLFLGIITVVISIIITAFIPKIVKGMRGIK